MDTAVTQIANTPVQRLDMSLKGISVASGKATALYLAAPHYVSLGATLDLFPFHPRPTLPVAPAKNARKTIKAIHEAECLRLQNAWVAKVKATKLHFIKLARDEDWGFDETTEYRGYYCTKESFTRRYVPFPELREWLLGHLPADVEDSVVTAIKEFDYDGLSAQIALAWSVRLTKEVASINHLKRTYDTFLEEIGTPAKQQPWTKKARIDKD